MALESATYIDELVASNPVSGDGVSQGDDHIRLIKSVLQATFPNLSGPVSLSDTELALALLKSGGQMTGALGVDAGSVSLPGLFLEGDTSSGLYRPGANQLALAISGVRAMLIAAAGAVTFDGAVTASTTLAVTGNATFGGTVGIAGALTLTTPLALTGLSITGGTAETAIALDDLLPLYDTSATANRKMTPVNLLKVLNLLTEDTTPDLSGDFVLTYDASESTVKKVKPSNLVTASSVPAGTIIARSHAVTTAVVTCTGAIPVDNSIPQNTEGTEVLTVNHTPSASGNKLLVRAVVPYSPAGGGANDASAIALFIGSTAAALAAVADGDGPLHGVMTLEHVYTATGTSQITFKIRAGNAGGDMYVNGDSAGTRLFGGVSSCTLTVEEMKA